MNMRPTQSTNSFIPTQPSPHPSSVLTGGLALKIRLEEILNRKKDSRLLRGKRLEEGGAIITKHAVDRMEERGINRASMKVAVDFGRKETINGRKRFWLAPSIVKKLKRKGIDLTWAQGVVVVICDGVCATTYQDEESKEIHFPRQRFLRKEGQPFNWARTKNRILADEDWGFQMVA
jgi:hypothetical protein